VIVVAAGAVPQPFGTAGGWMITVAPRAPHRSQQRENTTSADHINPLTQEGFVTWLRTQPSPP
jgi:hypothetical protein